MRRRSDRSALPFVSKRRSIAWLIPCRPCSTRRVLISTRRMLIAAVHRRSNSTGTIRRLGFPRGIGVIAGSCLRAGAASSHPCLTRGILLVELPYSPRRLRKPGSRIAVRRKGAHAIQTEAGAQYRLSVSNSQSSGNRDLEQSSAMPPPNVTVKQGGAGVEAPARCAGVVPSSERWTRCPLYKSTTKHP